MHDHLQITEEERRSAFVVKLYGELDLGSADELRNRLEAAKLDARPQVVVDLRQLAFLDSSGLRALIMAERTVTSSGKRFGLIAGSRQIQRIFEVSGTIARFEWIDPWDVD